MNTAATKLLKLGLPEKKAVIILATQKTLPVSITLVNFLPDALGNKGLLTIPCIIAHFVQILIDGFLVARWEGNDDDDDDDDDDDEKLKSAGDADGGELSEICV